VHTPRPTPNHAGCPGQYGRPHWPGGCRCLVDATPTHAFVRALAAIGWPLEQQGRLIGQRHGRDFFRILTRHRIERGTALRVGWLYARLWDVPGPSPRAVTMAARLGWTAPDPVVVARLVADIDCPHTKTDRDQAIRVLLAAGRLPVTTIAGRLHAADRTVRGIHHRGGWAPAPTATTAAFAS
jgi:hypothetical protein